LSPPLRTRPLRCFVLLAVMASNSTQGVPLCPTVSRGPAEAPPPRVRDLCASRGSSGQTFCLTQAGGWLGFPRDVYSAVSQVPSRTRRMRAPTFASSGSAHPQGSSQPPPNPELPSQSTGFILEGVFMHFPYVQERHCRAKPKSHRVTGTHGWLAPLPLPSQLRKFIRGYVPTRIRRVFGFRRHRKDRLATTCHY